MRRRKSEKWRGRIGNLRGWWIRAVVLILTVLNAGAADPVDQSPARLKISGYGFLGNMRLERTVMQLEFPAKIPRFFGPNFIEDSAFILKSQLADDGYLASTISAFITSENNSKLIRQLDDSTEAALSPQLQARQVLLSVTRGVRYHYTQIEFAGLEALPEKTARGFFVQTGGLILLQQNSVYSPERLKSSTTKLAEALERIGFQSAEVTVLELKRDDQTGDVRMKIGVHQGPRFLIRSVRQNLFIGDSGAMTKTRTNFFTVPFSKMWEQDLAQTIKTNYYRYGYPLTTVDIQTLTREPTNDFVLLDLLAEVKTGPQIKIGKVDFRGNMRTTNSTLKKHVPLHGDELLDPTLAENGEYRLARLGIFDSVQMKYEPVSTNLWNIVYDLKEGKRLEISPLFGFGSFDLLRLGIDVDQYNLWGLPNNSKLELIQSFKSTSADYTYTIPELLGENADVFVTGSYLRREEISFLRTEFGGGAGVRRLFREIDTDTSLRYNYGILQATEIGADFAPDGALTPTVGEIIGDINHDQRDNPLDPRKGYQIRANVELASQYLGGDANFQRFELAASWHIPLNDSQWLHLGLHHGVIATLGSNSQDLPFARRFFPGGENSVRGYQQGEAAPRNAQGLIVGAETYLSENVEFEQALTPKWSVVGFFDGVTFARRLADYPGNESLFSVGGGIQWHTLIGPIRLEYGYNLNPRIYDPTGTLQFSLGFPF